MASNDNNSEQELMNRIRDGGDITPQDIGANCTTSNGTTYLTEGTNALQFELNSSKKNK